MKSLRKKIMFMTVLMSGFFISLMLLAGEAEKPAAEKVDAEKPAAEKPADPNAIRLSGPYTYQNLSVFLVHRKDAAAKEQYLTLKEALDKGLVKVVETGSVGQLVINNNAENINIYIQSGDIVKGGKQDRTIQYDYILVPKQKSLDVNSFCVENGRWRQRGDEPAAEFGSSDYQLSSRELKMAAKYEGDQGRVWQEVARAQDRLSDSTGTSVRAPQSASSLQLSLEHKDVKEFTDQYTEKLLTIPEGKPDAVGFVYAINGQVVGADLYASAALFAKLWPKLLQSAVTEAVASYQKDAQFKEPTLDQAQAFLNPGEIARMKKTRINEANDMVIKETADTVIFETYTEDQKQPVHINYIRSEKDTRRQGDSSSDEQAQQPIHYRVQPSEQR
jgi:hypothetical protein